MTENISAQALFKEGLTREQFIQKYAELQQSGSLKDSSIFTEDFGNSLGQIFDTLNTNGNETLDAEEITTLQGLGDNDNKTLSEADLKALYSQMGKEIIAKHANDGSPEEMYKKAMATGDTQSNTYIQDLGQQIATLQELVTLRRINSTNIQQNYQAQIDDLVKKDSSLTTEQKTEYIKLSQELKSLQREADKNAAEIKQMEEKLRNNKNQVQLTQGEIDRMNPDDENNASGIATWTEDLNRLMSEQDDLNFQYTKLTSKQKTYNSKLTTTKRALNAKQDEITAKNPELKTKIEAYKNLMEQEKLSAQQEIESYEAQITTLSNAQAYAVEQMKNNPTPTATGGSEASHQNDNLMTFDELKAQGLQYSGTNGQKLAASVKSHLRGFTGYCARYVSNALAETGLGKERANATDMDNKLVNNKNFREIKVSSAEDLKRLPAGCILVYERGAAGYHPKYGHIEVTLGDGTAGSDGRTRNLRYSQNMSVFVPVEAA